MLTNIAWAVFVIIIFAFVAWRKYKETHKVTKQWEGCNPNESTKSTEELRQNENKNGQRVRRNFGILSQNIARGNKTAFMLKVAFLQYEEAFFLFDPNKRKIVLKFR